MLSQSDTQVAFVNKKHSYHTHGWTGRTHINLTLYWPFVYLSQIHYNNFFKCLLNSRYLRSTLINICIAHLRLPLEVRINWKYEIFCINFELKILCTKQIIKQRSREMKNRNQLILLILIGCLMKKKFAHTLHWSWFIAQRQRQSSDVNLFSRMTANIAYCLLIGVTMPGISEKKKSIA